MHPHDWSPRTLHDELLERQASQQAATAARRAGQVHGLAAPADLRATPGVDPHAPVRCVCRRRTHPSMMRDVTAVLPHLPPGTVPAGTRYICDACEERWYATGMIGRVESLRHRGAPEAWLAWYQREVLDPDPDVTGHPRTRRHPEVRE